MIHTIRSGENVSKISYDEAVLGSRRVRAAWQYFSVNNPERTEEIETKFKEHHTEMERIQLRSWELQDRRRNPRKPLSRIWHYGSGLHHGCLVLLLGQP